ncbi:MAG: hypothetical protein MRY79_04170 [Alphaproteobacteria bacterium]|nr:hypothetical protein [Alphaproteobacteria bacterium]
MLGPQEESLAPQEKPSLKQMNEMTTKCIISATDISADQIPQIPEQLPKTE